MKKSVMVGASSYTGNYLLPRMLPDWEQANPDTELRLEISDSENVFAQIENGNLEVGLIGACLESNRVCAEEFLPNDELVLIVPNNHPFAGRQSISINDLKGENFILREPGSATRMWYREWFNRYNLTFNDLNIVAELDSHPAVITAVECGAGIAMVPRLAAADAVQRGAIGQLRIEELAPMTGSLYMISPTADALSSEARQFMTFLEAEKGRLASILPQLPA